MTTVVSPSHVVLGKFPLALLQTTGFKLARLVS